MRSTSRTNGLFILTHSFCRNKYTFGIKVRVRALTTVPDSTSQKFLLVGQVNRKDQTNDVGRYVVVFLDFAGTRERKCGESDFEKWYARPAKSECLMGHKVRYIVGFVWVTLISLYGAAMVQASQARC